MSYDKINIPTPYQVATQATGFGRALQELVAYRHQNMPKNFEHDQQWSKCFTDIAMRLDNCKLYAVDHGLIQLREHICTQRYLTPYAKK